LRPCSGFLGIGHIHPEDSGTVDIFDPDTWRAIFDEGGWEDTTRKLILLVGQDRFGPADESVRVRLEAISDPEHLERICLAVLHSSTSNWQDLLDTP
jgi:hypothetical protein